MRLVDLPTELLSAIVSHVHPADLENFAQANHRIASISQTYLREHRYLIRAWSGWVAESPHVQPWELALANDVTANPRIGHYVRHLRYDTFDTLDHDHATNGPMDAFKAVLNCMPNLNSLFLMSEHLVCLQNVFDSSHAVRAAFPKLKSFEVESRGAHGVPWLLLQRFSTISSLKVLKAKTIDVTRDGGLIPWVPSQVVHLELLECLSSELELRRFLEGFTQLEILIFSTIDGYNRSIGSKSGVPIELQSCRTTLKKLVWLTREFRKPFIGDLTMFASLVELDVEYESLQSSRANSEVDAASGWDSSANWEAVEGQQLHSWPNTQIQLPRSMKTLRVFHKTNCSVYQYTELVGAVTRWKLASSSSLQTLVIGKIRRWEILSNTALEASLEMLAQSLKRKCHAVGISLVFRGLD